MKAIIILLIAILAVAAVAAVSYLIVTKFPSVQYALVGNPSSISFDNQMGSSNNSTKTTITETAAIPDFNVAAVGDWGCNSNSSATASNINSKNPEVVIALGDLSYTSTFDCWLNEVAPLDSRMHIVIGNHDAEDETRTDLQKLMSHYGLANQYYSFNYQNIIHFAIVSTELPYTPGTAQYNFVNNDLALASSNPNIKWKIVMFHKPAYTSPGGHDAIAELRDALHPLFDKYDVDFVLQGHNHNYQRMYPLKYNNNNQSSPIITTTEKANYGNYDGEIWLVAGTGGQSQYSFSGQAPFVIYQQAASYGFLNLDFTNNGNTVTGKFYSNGNGSIQDTFTVTKGEDSSSIIPTSQ